VKLFLQGIEAGFRGNESVCALGFGLHSRDDNMTIHLAGNASSLLERLLQTRLIEAVTHLLVQFHRFVPDAVDRRRRIREGLAATHQLTYDYEFIWESWSRKATAQDAPGKAMER
jgi:hypothetical protein